MLKLFREYGGAPSYLSKLFKKLSDIHLDIPKRRTSLVQRRFGYRAAKVWNSLRNEISQSILIFIRKVKKRLDTKILIFRTG